MSSFESLWSSLLGIGRDDTSGGYRRFAWTSADMTLREWFSGEATARGLDVQEDRNGNLWAWWMPPGVTGDPRDAFVTGSHLDSVPDGGAFDGPLGVVSALHAVDLLREQHITPTKPIAVTAFSDEEGARFGVACMGSRLSTGVMSRDHALALRDEQGTTLAEAMGAQGRDPRHVGRDTELAERVGTFVELHIEQGRALGPADAPLGIASSIWPHGRWRFDFAGRADHAGTTRLVDRRDPMLVYAATVLAARAMARSHGGVATFGKVAVTPNGTNAIASSVTAWLDARAGDETTLAGIVDDIVSAAGEHADAEQVSVRAEAESTTPVVDFSLALTADLQATLAEEFGDIPVLPTAAGHDAGILASVVASAMLFVRNPTGVSHSPHEYADPADCEAGAQALATIMRAQAAS
ncbi:allantoate amidohydrolase [Gordonia jinhuaensis]|uniref:Zn-dependent hydrolase n=1 Tax=Gordonia jinhuaensis TaxID=1517702 RepID=A0A916WRG8_9ACTN|nr:allantoate amidohydrolase [Gordonia jinhuaensis]GGB22903.1 Zn-dependent hydrolase [Gordonia jinhuaensis]